MLFILTVPLSAYNYTPEPKINSEYLICKVLKLSIPFSLF